MPKTLKFIVPKHCDNMTGLTFLKQECKLSTRMITLLKRKKDGILMDGENLRTIDFVKYGKTVIISLPQDDKSAILPVKGELVVEYEDDYLLIVNKPPLMPVHPVKQHQLDTLANIVAFYSQQKNESYVFRAINRLDKDTSGLVIIAKDKFTANAMKNITEKIYYALCEGVIDCSGTVNKPIDLMPNTKIVRWVTDSGYPSITHYFPVWNNKNYTLVKLVLETGRTHQIRCHMSSIFHPLLGDDLYGGGLSLINRQALHCGEISFVHPITNKLIQIKTELPNDMKALVKTGL